MVAGVIGFKVGMTRILTADGLSIPVSVVQVHPHRVTQIKTPLQDGYSAIQVTTGVARANRVNKALAGHYKKAGVEAGLGLWEFSMNEAEANEYAVGTEITVAMFSEGEFLDVAGKTKGRGFSGVIRRHNFRSQRASHGNSLSHRAPGSIGQNQSPGRVFPGKRMAGQYGNTNVTTQGLEIVRVISEKNLILIKGAIPGAPGGCVTLTPSVKRKKKA